MIDVPERKPVENQRQASAAVVGRRRFLEWLGWSSAAAVLAACARQQPASTTPAQTPAAAPDLTAPVNGMFVLPALPYAYNALEPHIDEQTMHLHHDQHHQSYVDTLNEAIARYPAWQGKPASELLQRLPELPDDIRTTVRNHGGGHVNHTLFWETMAPGKGGEPAGSLASAINASFGSFAALKEQMSQQALERFGSGWAWLVAGPQQLLTFSTPNQDSPYLAGLVPLLGLDVWEHAYYLKYQNQRAAYVDAWWNTINWDAVEQRFSVLAGYRQHLP